jgi:hypothetical protein
VASRNGLDGKDKENHEQDDACYHSPFHFLFSLFPVLSSHHSPSNFWLMFPLIFPCYVKELSSSEKISGAIADCSSLSLKLRPKNAQRYCCFFRVLREYYTIFGKKIKAMGWKVTSLQSGRVTKPLSRARD